VTELYRLSFHVVEQLDLFRGILRPDSVILQGLFKFPPRMRPTAQKKYAFLIFINSQSLTIPAQIVGRERYCEKTSRKINGKSFSLSFSIYFRKFHAVPAIKALI
jgi:hypothetical protein